MAENEAADGLQPMARQPANVPSDLLDFGDAAQRAEMEGIADPTTDEPLALVDEPIRIRSPFRRTHKKRNQRPMPT